jgi:ADP-ribose pyrophosphatase YjhB (NUDIX family)
VSDVPPIEQVEAALRAMLAEAGEWTRPAASAVLVSPVGHVLRGTPHTTRWEYPGGGLDEGEITLEAALREVREEACCVGAEEPGLAPLEPGGARRSPS